MAKVIKKLSVQDKIEQGILGLKFSGGTSYGNIYEDKRADFTFPKSIATFQYMSQHPVIAASNNLIDILIGKVKWAFTVPDNATGKQKEANRFLNFLMNNMDHSWKSFINEVLSYKIFGFHVTEKVWKEITPQESRKFAGKQGWKKLAARSQSTIAGWKFDDFTRELLYVFQEINTLSNIYNIKTDENGLIKLDKNKLLLFSYRSTRGNPEGHSPLKDCYQSWSYLKTIESYQACGVAKDMGGIPVMGIDASWLAKAQEDPTGSEGTALSIIQTNLENLHAGNSTYFIKPILYTDSGKELFSFELKGIDGSGGKTYDTSEIIRTKQLEMLMVFLTDILILGNSNHGSFSLAESKQNLTSFGIENHLQFIVDVIQEQLVRQTLEVNGFDLNIDQYPILTYSDLDNENIDEIGKLIQRLASTNMIPRSTPVINEILERSGFKYRLQDGDSDPSKRCKSQIPYDDLFTTNETGASEGMEEGLNSGTGSSLKNNSNLNMDNKA